MFRVVQKKILNLNVTNVFISSDKPGGIFSKCVFFLNVHGQGTSSTKLGEACCSSIPIVEVWTKFEKPQAPAALPKRIEEHAERVTSSRFPVSRFQTFLACGLNDHRPRPRNESSSGERSLVSLTLRKGVRPQTRRAAFRPRRPASATSRQLPLGPATRGTCPEAAAPRRPRRPRRDQTGAGLRAGAASAAAAWGAGLLPGPKPAAARFRRAPPRPAPCGLARPRCHVGSCGRRRGRGGGGVGSLAQSPDCGDSDHRREPGRAAAGSVLFSARRAVGFSFPWPSPPPRAGGAARCCASDCPPPAPVTARGNERSPACRRRRPGLPAPPATP